MKKDPYYSTEPLKQRAAVYHIENLLEEHKRSSDHIRTAEERLIEAVHLTEALGVEIHHKDIITVKKPSSKLHIGSGRAEDIASIVDAYDIDVVVINAQLTPTQQRNLELTLGTKVIDRTYLILEIFADRAKTKAGRLQVELAQQTYMQGRLVRAWTHLERQRGGTSSTGGPGERQIELDRRMIRDRIAHLKSKLKDVEKERDLQRRSRKKQELPLISLVGYTNAGKSTLFNAIVNHTTPQKEPKEDAFVKDMLFATLDPLIRQIKLPSGKFCLISDTVGFVSDLPHELVDAFASTLEEVTLSHLILHVHDSSSVEAEAQSKDVQHVLKQIHAQGISTLHIANKIDLSETETSPHFLEEYDALKLSAFKGDGVEDLLKEIDLYLAKDEKTVSLQVPAQEGKILAFLHAEGILLQQNLEDDLWHITVRLKEKHLFMVQAYQVDPKI